MSDLHTEGWRQGSIVSVRLTATFLTKWRSIGRARRGKKSFHRWVVCTQDCDLSRASIDSYEAVVELRPVLDTDPPNDWGIRSRRLRLSERALCRC